jgi:hypothetical protein
VFKKLIAAVAAILVGLVVLAPAAQATTGQYVKWIRSNVDGSYSLSYAQIAKMGKMICTSLDEDVDIYELGEIAVDSGYSTEEAAAWVVGAVYFVCPRHKWMLS